MIDLSNIPKNPGCYLFKDSEGKVIYVGKAKSLSKRVKSYFQKKDHDIKTAQLVKQILDVEFLITDSEHEALVLENNLIKKHKPKYNINLKDSRRYAYLMITNEKYPRLLVARTRHEKLGAEYFGPFTSGLSRQYIQEMLQKTFGIRTCNKLPKRACIRHAMGLCSAPCINEISKEDYDRSITAAKSVLKGKYNNVIKLLDNDMRQASRDLNFEKAMKIRNQIYALKSLEEKQKVERQKGYNEDILDYIEHEGTVYLALFNTKKGILENKQDFEFYADEDFLDQFLVQYYSEHEIPKELILPKKPSISTINFLRSNKKGFRYVVPLKGDKKQLLDLVKKNIEVNLFGDMKILEELSSKLKLNQLPRVIECFDISHLGGTSTTASMVQFRNGKPDKNHYRRFKIRTVEGIDDYAAMKEVISRRYNRLKQENADMPDLIIIDGGKGQLTAALDMMNAMFLKVPIISIAKREEEIFVPGRKTSIKLPKKSEALKLVQRIRDEAHRFAINYNRLLRKKKIREE